MISLTHSLKSGCMIFCVQVLSFFVERLHDFIVERLHAFFVERNQYFFGGGCMIFLTH